ncbi:MAG: hypothetical protein IPL83_08820 [Bdellovibrionales bacterium]|nr:hypothetical protein [Bdellovibrionales bacterium]
MTKGSRLQSLLTPKKLRLIFLCGTIFFVLLGLFQNCGRWQEGIENPHEIYSDKLIEELSRLDQSEKESLCHSAANYFCQRIRLGKNLPSRVMAEMICIDHEAFPRRVCIQTDIIEGFEWDQARPCKMCSQKKFAILDRVQEEYSCFNAALKTRTLIEHRIFAMELSEALTRSYLACKSLF